MAAKTVYGTVSANSSHYSYYLYYSYTTNYASNTTSVYVSHGWAKTGSKTFNSVSERTYGITCNGESKTGSKVMDYDPWPNNTDISAYTFTVAHNANGDAKTINISSYSNCSAGTYGPGYSEASTSVTLPSTRLTNTIDHWSFGYTNGEGNNGNKTAYKIGSTTFTSVGGVENTYDTSRGITIPNGFYLSTTCSSGSFSSDGSWTSYSMPYKVKQPGKNTNMQYDYRPNTYTITYTMNGGTNSSSNPSSYNVLYGVTFANPSRTGYTLKNWTIDGTAVTGINPGANATWSSIDDMYCKCSSRTVGNKTVVANWTANTYTVNFNANGGSTPTASKTVTYDSTYGTLPTPTRDGYTFNGWYTAASGGTKVTSSTKVTITATQTLYAQWTIKTYTITYDGNGGTNIPEPQTKTHGTDLVLSSVRPYRNDTVEDGFTVTFDDINHYIQIAPRTGVNRTSYTYIGWDEDKNASILASYAPGGVYAANASTTLYAIWRAVLKTEGITLPTQDECIRPGYTLLGFSTEPDGQATYAPGEDYIPRRTLTLYAIWSVDQVQVKIKTDNGWVKGKLFIKVNGHWVKGKKIFKKENNTWVPGINS